MDQTLGTAAFVSEYDVIPVRDAHTTEPELHWGRGQQIALTNLYWTYPSPFPSRSVMVPSPSFATARSSFPCD
jgi:hypothetical protein